MKRPADASSRKSPDQIGFLQFLRVLAPQRISIGIAVFLSLCSAGFSLVQPAVVSRIIDSFTDSLNMGLVGILAVALVCSSLFGALEQLILERASERLVFSIRESIVSHVLRFKISVFDRTNRADLTSTLGADTAVLRGILSQGIVDLVSQSFTMVAALAMMLYLDWLLFLVCAAVVFFLLITGIFLGARTRPAAESLQTSVGEMSAEFDRSLQGIRTVRAFRSTARFEKSIVEKALVAKSEGFRVAKLKAIVSAFTSVAIQLMLLAVIGLGALRVSFGALSIGELSAFIMYAMLVLTPAAMLGGVSASMNEALGAYNRVNRIELEELEDDGSTLPAVDTRACDLSCPAIEFKGVSFGYVKTLTILKNLSIAVRPRTVTAIVGPSGAGKTTVFQLLERFYTADSGEIRLSGKSIMELPLETLRSSLTLVEQECPVFSGTIRDNLLLANSLASDAECIDALQTVGLHQLLPANGGQELILDRLVGEGGVALSGGERQRLAIARGLISPSEIILLDEATSNLDGINEAKLHIVIRQLAATKTVLIIAHRLSTVVNADLIHVLDRGCLIGSGTHSTLLETTPIYRELVESQLVSDPHATRDGL